jgi:ATP-dependent Lon protease
MPKNMKSNKRSPKSDDGSSSDSDVDEENIVLDNKEYKKFLNELFPSKYMKQKVKEIEEKECSAGSDKKDSKNKQSKKKSARATSPKKKEDEDDEKKNKKNKKDQVDIIFTILPPKKKGKNGDDNEEEYEEYTDSDDSDYEEEEESEEESDDEEDESEEEEEYDEEDESEEEEEEEDDEEEDTSEEEDEEESVSETKKKTKEDEYEVYNEFSKFMKKIKSNKGMDKKMKSEFEQFEKSINKKKEKMEKKTKSKHLKKYIDLISNKSLINDVKFFRNSLSCNEQEKMLGELEKLKSLTKIDKPYRIQLLENHDIPDKFKAIALKKINSMKVIADGGGEYNKLKNWIDTFMRIPFNKIDTLPVSRESKTEDIHEFMDKSQMILDNAVYGMNDAKAQFMQMVAQWVANPLSIGNAIAIKGPMGTGKTTLIKYGVSKLLNREFAFIPLGGATDSSYLEGHSYTYEGSTYGKIVDILIQCKTSNPVIFFDELDKVSDTPKGEEIIGVLTHLTDTTQNDKFHDKYFSEIDFDLSKCLFVFSYNDESKINPILKDRMYNIETKGYNADDKIIICNKYLIPKIENELNMDKHSIVIDDEIIKYIVEKFTKCEKGVRNLKRCLEIIYSKLNLYKFMKPGTKLFGDDIIENIEFPYNVSKEIVDKIIKINNEKSVSHMSMYI